MDSTGSRSQNRPVVAGQAAGRRTDSRAPDLVHDSASRASRVSAELRRSSDADLGLAAARCATCSAPSAPAGGAAASSAAPAGSGALDSALDPDVREEGPVGTELPDLPTDDAVRLAFESVRERVRRCLSGRSATLDCRAEVDGPTGRPTSTSVTGDEASSSCVRGIVDALEFPAFAQPTATVRYTYRFRTVSPTSPRPPPPSRTDAGGQRTIGTIDESYPQVGENPF